MVALSWRGSIGPVVLGACTWCALGDVSVLSADDPATRVAAPASVAWLFVVAVAAAGLPSIRRHPVLVLPAVFATLPWWPLPMPAMALLWAGRFGWVALLLTAVSVLAFEARQRGWAIGSSAGLPRSMLAAGAATAAAAALAAWSLAPRLPGGDELHYLIITQSLLGDGDLRIENNHAARDYAAYYPDEIRPDFLRRGKDGAIYSIHAPGTSVVVLPAFALFGYAGAQATLLLVAALTGALTWWGAWLVTRAEGAAWFGWLAIVATPTFLIQSVTIFPDGLGAFVSAAGMVLVIRLGSDDRDVSSGRLVAASALFAALPWLHTRFAVLAAGFGLIVLGSVLRDTRRPLPARLRRAGSFLAVPVASAVGWLAFFYVIYGVADPRFPYGDAPNTHPAYVPGGLLGMFFDGQFGLLTYSPILMATFVGLLEGPRTNVLRLTRVVTAAAFAYLAAATTYWMWWGGVPAPPARFAAAVLPIFALGAARAWQASAPALRVAWGALLGASVTTAAVALAVDRGGLLWNVRGVRAAWLDWLNGVADLSRGWPSFFWRLNPADLRSETHFPLHVLVWMTVLSLTIWAVVWRRQRPDARPEFDGVVVALAMAGALTAAADLSWRLNGSSGVNAARSQLHVLNVARQGGRLVEIAPARYASSSGLDARLRIEATRADPVGEPAAAWQPLLDVPPGTYAVTMTSRRPRTGALAVRLRRASAPLRVLPVAARNEQTATLALPAGAAAVFLEPDPAFARVADTIVLTPLAPAAWTGMNATGTARYGGVDVFFQGNAAVFPEADRVWVRGGHTAALTLAPPAGTTHAMLSIGNGEAVNDVTLVSSAGEWRFRLAPGSSRTVRVPLTADGTAAVRISSSAGFRPSESGGDPNDHRYLGVWVTVTPGGESAEP